MKRLCWKMWNDEAGVLSFEWTLLLTLVTIGVVGGLAAALSEVPPCFLHAPRVLRGAGRVLGASTPAPSYMLPGSSYQLRLKRP